MMFSELVGGIEIALDGRFPATRKCRWCGCETGYLSGGTGTHSEGVRCIGCNRHLGWLPKGYDDDLLEDFDLIED